MLARFRTKKEKHSYMKSVVYSVGCGYVMPDDEYFSIFVELVSKKWSRDEFEYFSVVPNRINTGTFECQVHLVDGEIKVFSWNKLVMDRVSTDYSKIRSSMRSAIVSDILKFKRDAVCCNICGSVEILHADHVNPFRDLANTFIADGGDIVDMNEWVAYHKNNAVLQILCARCNFKKH